MLTDEARAKAARQVKQFTETYKTSGFNVQGPTALPTFDSQEDFDRCRPEEKGMDFRLHNEFIEEVAKGLAANGVPAKPVVFHYAAFSKWLNGQPITPQGRAAYGAYLMAEAFINQQKD